MKSFLIKISICVFLVLITSVVYWQIQDHGPINADDFYLTTNKHIDEGITCQSLFDAMRNVIAGIWMPLTYGMVGIESELFGTDFGSYHLFSAFLHAANAIILFLLLLQMTRSVWKCALVATVFTIHPINVEPVAWLVCIRVVLCGFFCLLTIYLYVLYTRHKTVIYHLLSLFCYTASLLSVPMFLPLPFLLLLLDLWPLDRLRREKNALSLTNLSLTKIRYAIWEKFPFFSIMAVFLVFLLFLHDLSPTIESYPLHERIFNIFFSYIKYIQQIIIPTNLAIFYPFPASFPSWKILGAVLVLTIITVFAFMTIHRYPFFLVGWLWFAGMLFPLSGIAQIGTQARADHYMYLPMIGLLILLCWGISLLVKRLSIPAGITAFLAIIIIAVLAGLSWRQAGFWKNSVTIMTHAIRVTDRNYEAHNYLGQALASRGDLSAAVHHFKKALSIKPAHQKSNINIANTCSLAGNLEEAIPHLSRALEKEPKNPKLHNNLGALYEKTNNIQSAIFHYQRAIEIDPKYIKAYANLAGLRARIGDLDNAIDHFRKALDLVPQNAEIHFRLGVVLNQTGKNDEAIEHTRRALELAPGNKRYRRFMMLLLENK